MASDGRVDPVDPDLAPSDAAQPSFAHRRADQAGRPSANRARPDVLAAIAAGGALGAPARYEVAQVIHVAKGSFPWATFWTNVSGSFVLGLVLILMVERFPPSRYLRPFFATGFLGAFTTFSTLAVETDLLIKDGEPVIGIVYAVASVVAGLAAAWAGIRLARLASVPARAAS